jgi:hypothetical protein
MTNPRPGVSAILLDLGPSRLRRMAEDSQFSAVRTRSAKDLARIFCMVCVPGRWGSVTQNVFDAGGIGLILVGMPGIENINPYGKYRFNVEWEFNRKGPSPAETARFRGGLTLFFCLVAIATPTHAPYDHYSRSDDLLISRCRLEKRVGEYLTNKRNTASESQTVSLTDSKLFNKSAVAPPDT